MRRACCISSNSWCMVSTTIWSLGKLLRTSWRKGMPDRPGISRSEKRMSAPFSRRNRRASSPLPESPTTSMPYLSQSISPMMPRRTSFSSSTTYTLIIFYPPARLRQAQISHSPASPRCRGHGRSLPYPPAKARCRPWTGISPWPPSQSPPRRRECGSPPH